MRLPRGLLAVILAAGAWALTSPVALAGGWATTLLDPLPAPGKIAKTTTKDAVGITEWELSNGVRVVLMPTTLKQDEILFRAVSPGGTSLASDQDYIHTKVLVAAIALAGSAACLIAQNEGGPGPGPRGPGGPGGPGGRRMPPPLVGALDANHDGTIDATEIDNAPAALRKLDKNGDGKLTMEELGPPPPNGRGPRGPGGPGGPRGPGGPGGPGGPDGQNQAPQPGN